MYWNWSIYPNVRPIESTNIYNFLPHFFTTMVVVTSTSSNLTTHFTNKVTCCKPVSPLLQFFNQIYGSPRRPSWSKLPNNCNGVVCVRAYMENPNSFSSFASKVIGSLPVVGLLARILSDEGGVGGDIIDFAEFRRRVGKNCSVADSKAFYDFQDRRGPVMNNLC